MKKDLKFYLNKAIKEGFCLGALNFSNMECLQGIVEGAKEMNSPIIISVSEGALKYMQEDYCISLANVARKNKGIFLHLDHGKSYEICKKCIDLGFDSVMIDGSSLPFQDNIKITKKVVNYAHKKGVLVEGELGQLMGIEDEVSSQTSHYTDPDKAKEFVDKTGVDTLAIAIGTSHGAYKYSGEKTLHFDILKEIEKLLPNFPLVLHGASTVDQSVIEKINEYGGELKSANGIPKNLLKKAVKQHNIVKINTDTDLRLATTMKVREVLINNSQTIDPRDYLKPAREEIKATTIRKIKELFYSSNKL